jgi:hypothetical protein
VVVELPEVDQDSLSEPARAGLRAISRRTSGRSKNTKAIENRILIKEGEAVEERDVLLHGPG